MKTTHNQTQNNFPSEIREMVAVALAYNEDRKSAPKITAKGSGYIAKNIIETAEIHGIPIKEDANLATLLAMAEIGDTIPVDVFVVVAEIISYIMHQSGGMKSLNL